MFFLLVHTQSVLDTHANIFHLTHSLFSLQRYIFFMIFAYYGQKITIFVLKFWNMEKILRVHSVNDYARYIGAPELHPLVSVIHYDELEHCRHSLNSYDVYALFIGDEELGNVIIRTLLLIEQSSAPPP